MQVTSVSGSVARSDRTGRALGGCLAVNDDGGRPRVVHEVMVAIHEIPADVQQVSVKLQLTLGADPTRSSQLVRNTTA